MHSEDPWANIRMIHSRFKFVCVLFSVLFVICLVVFPMAYVPYWLILVGLATFIFFQTSLQSDIPCPICGKPFFIWSEANWNKNYELYSKNLMTHSSYLAAWIYVTCSHCETPMDAPIDIDKDS